MPKEKFEREPEGRFDRDDYKRPEEDKLHAEPESPYQTVILSPSMVKINGTKPAFDVLATDYAKVVVPAYLQFLKGGAKEIVSEIESDHSGLVTFEYTFKDPKTGKSAHDFWDYQGPMKLKFKARFLGEPAEGVDEAAALKFFTAGGYDDSDPVMRPHEDVLSGLRAEVHYELLNFAVNPFLIPFNKKQAYKMSDEDFVRKILAAKPELFIHWRVT